MWLLVARCRHLVCSNTYWVSWVNHWLASGQLRERANLSSKTPLRLFMCQSRHVDFAVHSREVGAAAVITVSGELDIHTAPDLTEVLSPGIAAGQPVIVDLTDVTFMDSSGLSVFVTALKRAREAGTTLTLVVSEPRVMRVFSITGIDTLIDIHATLDSALSA